MSSNPPHFVTGSYVPAKSRAKFHQPHSSSKHPVIAILHTMSSAENGSISQGEGKDPSSFLSDIIGNPVIVKLNSGVVYKGEALPETLPQRPVHDAHERRLCSIKMRMVHMTNWMRVYR